MGATGDSNVERGLEAASGGDGEPRWGRGSSRGGGEYRGLAGAHAEALVRAAARGAGVLGGRPVSGSLMVGGVRGRQSRAGGLE